MNQSKGLPRILAIHAHPDDVEFQCSGTLALLQKLGCPVTVATMTAGDCGSAEYGPLEIARIRREEGRQGAQTLGADYICLEFLDLQIVVDNDSRRRVTEVIRKVRPDIVFTAPPVDYMSDHEMTSRLVRDACFNASTPNYQTQQQNPALPTDKIPHLFYVDAVGGIDLYGHPLNPQFVVDVSSVYDLKRQSLACHASQRNWLLRQHGMDEYLESCDRWCSSRGQLIGTKYGEGFRQHLGHPYPESNPLLNLLPCKPL